MSRFARCAALGALVVGVLAIAVPALPAVAAPRAPLACASARLSATGLPAGATARFAANGAMHRAGTRTEVCAAGGAVFTALPVTVRGTTYFPSLAGGPALAQSFRASGRRAAVRVDYGDAAPATTRVVATQALVSVRPGSVVLRAGAARGLRAGDVLVALHPSGVGRAIIRRVLSIGDAGGLRVVRTTSAAVTAAFSRMSLHWASARRPAADTKEALTASCSANGFSEVTAGQAQFNPSATFSLGWSFIDYVLPVVSGSATLTPGISGGMSFKTNGPVACTGTQQLASVPIGVFSTEFGDFSFAMNVNLEVSGSSDRVSFMKSGEKLNGSVGESFNIGAEDDLAPTDTLAEGGWTSKVRPPVPFLGSWTGTFGPSLGVQYGIAGVVGAGPEIGIADQETVVGGTTGWTLEGGLAATVGVDFSIEIPGTGVGVSWTDQDAFPLTTYTLRSKPWAGGVVL